MKTPEQIAGVAVRCEFAELAPTLSLNPHPKNPNKHPPEQVRLLARVIQHQGWRTPIVVSRRSGFVVSGHGRLEAAKLLEMPSVPVDFQEFASAEDELAHLVADNKLPELAEMERRELNAIVKELEEADFDTTLAGIISDEAEEAAGGSPEIPITAKLNESYDYVVIYTKNDVDFVHLCNLCGVRVERSYKKTGVGLGRCVSIERFLHALDENHHPVNEPVANDDHAPAAD